ncbi:MAG: porin [Pikeienuella sp.]
MNKLLMTTSALVMGFAGAASAGEWETGVSGFMLGGVGLTDGDNQNGIGVMRDGEVHFDARLAADNGIVFAAHAELEAFTDGADNDQIDENWLRVIGAFGLIEIGSDATVGYEQVTALGIVAAPEGRIGYADASGLTTAALVSESAYVGIAEDGIGIHYSTPDFGGFQAHASYLPSLDSDGVNDTNNFQFDDNNDEAWSVAATFVREFGDFGVGVGGHYSDIEGVRGEQLGIVGNVSYMGFTAAGFFEDDFNGDEFGVGLQYQTGPWTVAGGYTNSREFDNQIASAWVTYDAAPGVSLTAGVEYADDDTISEEDFGGAAYIAVFF